MCVWGLPLYIKHMQTCSVGNRPDTQSLFDSKIMQFYFVIGHSKGNNYYKNILELFPL